MGTENENEDQEGSEGEDKTFTQDDLDKILKRETAKASRSAVRDLLKALGVESTDELKEKLNPEEKPETGKKSKGDDEGDDRVSAELAKRLEKIEKDLGKKDGAISELNAKDLHNRKVIALMDEGLDRKTANRLAKMLDDLEVDADEDDIAEAIEDLRDDMPHLFETKSNEGEEKDERKPRRREAEERNRKPNSFPGAGPRKSSKSSSAADRARTMLEERHGDRLKSKQK